MPNSTRSSPSHAPTLRDLASVGTDVASQLLVTVGDNPERVTTEAKFAALVGVAPIPASSGKTTRHRLNRAGDRQANKAIHRIVLIRMRYDSRTRTYVARRRQEGKSTKEIMRCLKRYVAREIYDQLLHPSPAPHGGTLRTTRTAKRLTLQQAADALHAWPTTLSRLERGLSHDNDLHKRYVAREIYDQLLHPRPAPDAGSLRTVRTTKQLTLQQAADALHVWPTTLSRLERGLTHDNDFHQRYETWLNCQSPATMQTPHPVLARVLPA